MRRTVTYRPIWLEKSTFGPRKLRLGMLLLFKLCGLNKVIAHFIQQIYALATSG